MYKSLDSLRWRAALQAFLSDGRAAIGNDTAKTTGRWLTTGSHDTNALPDQRATRQQRTPDMPALSNSNAKPVKSQKRAVVVTVLICFLLVAATPLWPVQYLLLTGVVGLMACSVGATALIFGAKGRWKKVGLVGFLLALGFVVIWFGWVLIQVAPTAGFGP